MKIQFLLTPVHCPVLAVNELKSETNSESFHEQKQFTTGTDLYAVVPGGNIT